MIASPVAKFRRWLGNAERVRVTDADDWSFPVDPAKDDEIEVPETF